MSKFYEETCTRMYSLDLVKAWTKGEENLGLKNSLFLMKNGVITQFVDCDEGEAFHETLKQNLKNDKYFNEICESFFEAISNKDKVKMFECLAIFNEIDNYPEIANDDILRRLRRVRKTTEGEMYKL